MSRTRPRRGVALHLLVRPARRWSLHRRRTDAGVGSEPTTARLDQSRTGAAAEPEPPAGKVKSRTSGAELRNLEAQRRSTNHIVNEIDRPDRRDSTARSIESAPSWVLAQDNLAETRAILERRLVDIAKRGALYAWQVLLSAGLIR